MSDAAALTAVRSGPPDFARGVGTHTTTVCESASAAESVVAVNPCLRMAAISSSTRSPMWDTPRFRPWTVAWLRSEEHTSELQSRFDLVCRLLLEKKKKH